jgi:hypothetical protein
MSFLILVPMGSEAPTPVWPTPVPMPVLCCGRWEWWRAGQVRRVGAGGAVLSTRQTHTPVHLSGLLPSCPPCPKQQLSSLTQHRWCRGGGRLSSCQTCRHRGQAGRRS